MQTYTMLQERSNCYYFYTVLRLHLVYFWLCKWWDVFTNGGYVLSCFINYSYIPNVEHVFTFKFSSFITGKNWIKSTILTASLFPFLCFGIGFALNTVAIFYGSLAAIPFGTMVVVFVIWGFISFPLALLGTVVGRNWSGAPNNPCRVKTIPRPIPEKKWYLTPSVVSIMGGLLPFGSIFIEMYFVFTSFWNYKVILTISVQFGIASVVPIIVSLDILKIVQYQIPIIYKKQCISVCFH